MPIEKLHFAVVIGNVTVASVWATDEADALSQVKIHFDEPACGWANVKFERRA